MSDKIPKNQVRACIECRATSPKRWATKQQCISCYNRYQSSLPKEKIRKAKFRNSEAGKLALKNWELSNKFRILEIKKKYNKSDKGRLAQKRYFSSEQGSIKHYEWVSKNRKLANSYGSKYRAKKLQATPQWADLKKIQAVYINCPKGYEVDHIIPLQGRNVCGLHVEWNLQYLTKSENCKKNNRIYYGSR